MNEISPDCSLTEVIATNLLAARASRPPNYAAECRAFTSLAAALAESPALVMQRVAECARTLCNAHSAVVSILETRASLPHFCWRATAGAWTDYADLQPSGASPCGAALLHDGPLLIHSPEKHFATLRTVQPLAVEALVVPFYSGKQPIGTVWIVAHDNSRRFDAEDARMLARLSQFAAAAHSTLTRIASIQGMRGERLAALNLMEDAVNARREVEQTTAKLHETDARFRAMTDNAPVLLWETGPNGLTFANGHYLEFFGVNFQQLRGKGWMKFLHPDDAEEFVAHYQSAYAEKRAFTRNIRFRRADGQYRWLRNSGRPFGENSFVGSSLDLTEIFEFQERLRRSAEHQAFLVKLSDALRSLTDPKEIQGVAVQLLGEMLGAARVAYFTVQNDHYVVDRDFVKEGKSIAGRHPLTTFDPRALALYRRGQIFAAMPAVLGTGIRKLHATAGSAEGEAHLGVPLVKNGALVSGLVVNRRMSRAWTPEDWALVQDTAERIWIAVERARAEAAVAADLRDTQLLHQLSEQLVDQENTRSWNEQVLETAINLTHADAGSVQILDEAAQELVMIASRGIPASAADNFNRVSTHSNSACAVALRRGERVAMDYDPDSAESDASLRIDLDMGFVSSQATPLIARSGKPIGMITVHWRSRYRLDDRECRFIDLLARQAADFLERQHAGDALRKSEERLQLALDAAQLGTFVWHVQEDRSELDDRLIAFFGRQREGELTLANALSAAVHPEDVTLYAMEVARATDPSGSGKLRTEMRIRRPDNSEAWMAITAQTIFEGEPRRAVRMVGVVDDITERKITERELRESEQRLRALVENLPGGAAYVLDRNLRYLLVGGEALHRAGLSHEQFLGRTLKETVGAETAAQYEPYYRAAFAGEPFTLEHETHGHHYITRGVPLSDEAGDVSAVLAVSYDITDRIRAEEDLRASQERLQEADRRKNHFLAMLGHELRNPLAALRGGVALLRSTKTKPATREAALPVVAEQIAHMERMIDDLLDITRIVQGSLQIRAEPLVLQDTITRAVEILRTRPDVADFEICVSLADEPLPVSADPIRLTQVLLNILTNSLKYSGAVRRIEISATRREASAVISIRDYGLGISGELLPRVFEPFVQAKASLTLEGGLGLGLAVVRELVLKHGGKVEVFSEGELKGSEFVIHLPLTPKSS